MVNLLMKFYEINKGEILIDEYADDNNQSHTHNHYLEHLIYAFERMILELIRLIGDGIERIEEGAKHLGNSHNHVDIVDLEEELQNHI